MNIDSFFRNADTCTVSPHHCKPQTHCTNRSTFIQPPALGTLWWACARAIHLVLPAARSEHLQILSVIYYASILLLLLVLYITYRYKVTVRYRIIPVERRYLQRISLSIAMCGLILWLVDYTRPMIGTAASIVDCWLSSIAAPHCCRRRPGFGSGLDII